MLNCQLSTVSRQSLLSLTCVLCTAAGLVAGEPVVKLQKKTDTVEVTIGGEKFAVYNFGKSLPKPFFAPVRGPGGTILTRPIDPNEREHKHQRGIWLAIDEVNGVEFWGEKGRIENASLKLLCPEGNPAKLEAVNRWLDPQGNLVVTETTVISICANRVVAYDIEFSAGSHQVTFGDTKEGLFGFRMVNSMREKEGGHVVNADGLEGSKDCWGKTSDWIDYCGTVEGKTFGLTIFDHPQNFRRSRYHVRNYGLFSINPFGQKAYTRGKEPAQPAVVPPGKSLRLRYGMYVHAGDTKAARVAETYREYVKAAD